MRMKMVSDCNISLVDTNQVFDASVVALQLYIIEFEFYEFYHLK